MKDNKGNPISYWDIVKQLKRPIEIREANDNPEKLKETLYTYELNTFFISMTLALSSLYKNVPFSLCIAFLQSILYVFYLFLTFFVKPRDFSSIHIWIFVMMTSNECLVLLECVCNFYVR